MRLARRAALYLLVALTTAYIADSIVFQIRRARGVGLDSVNVDQYLRTPLKGSKNEYDYLGTASKACSRSLFPQYAVSAWNPPCWWVERHRTVWVEAEWGGPPGLRPTSTSAFGMGTQPRLAGPGAGRGPGGPPYL